MNLIFLDKSYNLSSRHTLIKKGSVVLLSPDLLPELDLYDELAGKSNYIKTLCVKSKEFNCLFLVGATLNMKNKTFWGTIIVDNGKFLGISDTTHPLNNKFDKSSAIKVFESSVGRVGVISGDDIFFPEIPRLLKLWEADVFFFSLPSSINKNSRILAKSHAICNGVTAVLFGKNGLKTFHTKSLIQKGNLFTLSPNNNDFYISHRRAELYGELIKKPF